MLFNKRIFPLILILWILLITACNTTNQLLEKKGVPTACAKKANLFTSTIKRTNKEGILKIIYPQKTIPQMEIIDQKLNESMCFFTYLNKQDVREILGKPMLSYHIHSGTWGYFILNNNCRKIRKQDTDIKACGSLFINFDSNENVISAYIKARDANL